MSENIPESVPTSSDKRSNRPTKKRATGPVSQQSAQLEALFANPDREIKVPTGPVARTAAAPPEIVANVQGSSAGAGSGEFHVYKASRRREYERLRVMDEENEKEEKEKEWEEKKARLAKEDEEKLAKNKAKRDKAKARKAKKGKGGAVNGEGEEGEKANGSQNGIKKRLGPAKIAAPVNPADGEGIDAETEANGQSGGGEEAGVTIHEDD